MVYTSKRNLERYPYAVYATALHGGGMVSQHRTLWLAEAALKRLRHRTGCVCGCVGIVDRTGHEIALFDSTIQNLQPNPIPAYSPDLYPSTVCS